MTANLLSAWFVRPLCFSVALTLAVGLATAFAQSEPAGTAAQQSSTVPKGAQSRVLPKHRKGKEGSDEAKIDADQARELYIRRKLRLEQIQSQQQELAKDQRTLATNRARMHARLVETARALRSSEKRLTEIEERLAEIRAQAKEQHEKLDDKSAQMSALFVLMQGMSRQPPPVMITHSQDALKMIRSGMVLAAFYGDVEKLATELSAEVARLDQLQKDAEFQEQKRKSEQVQNARLKGQVDLLLIENRDQLEAASEKLDLLKSANQINLAGIKTLEDMLPALEAAKKKAKPAAQTGGAAGESSSSSEKLAMTDVRLQSAIPFANSQGLLPLPAQGKIAVKFGQADHDGAASRGVHIETRPGAQVVSPCDGSILYAGPFRSYGQLLIINPGGGYHVVVAGMDRIQVVQGQAVVAGEPLATMGPETRSSEKTSARPILYVEFRKDQQTIDPAPWWSAGGKG
jgi:septal ring factor EnvC (AmiA/AmiB activator)